jgi:hypothetical protein
MDPAASVVRPGQQSCDPTGNALASDPQLRQLVWTIIQEVVMDNPRLHEVLQRHWQSPEAQAAFELAADRFEPTAIRISHLLFGDPHSGITPEFARVLRHEVLGKDRRWLVLQPGGGQHTESESLPVRPAETREVNPFVQLTVN